MSDPLAVSFEKAAENHLRDALRMTHAQRWQWLAGALELGEAVARSRARQGRPTLDGNGEQVHLPNESGRGE